MSERFLVVGIDVHKVELEVKWSNGPRQTVGNTAVEREELAADLARQDVDLVVVEPSGGYEKPLVWELMLHDVRVAVVNAKRVRAFAIAAGQEAKTDALDAELLVEFGLTMRPEPRPLPCDEQEVLAALMLRRRQLQRSLDAERARLATAHHAVRESHERTIASLREEQAAVEDQAAELLRWSPVMEDQAAWLRSVPGVGPILTQTLLGCLPELGQLARGQIASLVGVAPFAHDSGGQQGGRHIHGGRKTVRDVLYMATLSAIRYHPEIRGFYAGLVGRGKLKKVAVVACMRKLLLLLNTLMKEQRCWQATPPRAAATA